MTRRSGVPLVVSAPSGAGKTTLCHLVMERLAGVEYSISHTTRARRGQEQQGVDYHFVSDSVFDQMVAGQAFLEWAPVHGQRYGTARGPVADKLSAEIDVLFDIDVQGGKQIAARLPEAVLIFVLPPTMAVLEERLRGRQSDSEEQIKKRLTVAKQEMIASDFYHYFIVNDELEVAVAQLHAILVAERLRRTDHRALVHQLMGGDG